MSASNVMLILVSSLGVLHGLFLAVFLWVYPQGKRSANRLLSLLLLVLSFRIGKSVFLEFTPDLDVHFIFGGLATLMAIGPLFYFYTLSISRDDFTVKPIHLLHFIPTLLGLGFGLWISEDKLSTIPKVVFLILFICYYGHYLLYLYISYRQLPRETSAAASLLRLLFFGLLAIWFTYVLNLFDELIPYIFGPILYSIIAYVLSLVVIKRGYIPAIRPIAKYKSTSMPEEQIDRLYARLCRLIVEEEQYKNGELSLRLLSQQVNSSPQTISMIINSRAETNFNTFLNRFRIQEAIRLLEDPALAHRTIASIAFDAGFNSLSSFNAAFKKQTGKTPMSFRKKLKERSSRLPE